MTNPMANPKARIGVAFLAGVIAFAISFVAFGSMAIDIVMFLYEQQAGNDPKAGDSIGWAVVFAAPVLLGVDIVVSLAAALFVFTFARRALKVEPPRTQKVAIRFQN